MHLTQRELLLMHLQRFILNLIIALSRKETPHFLFLDKKKMILIGNYFLQMLHIWVIVE